MTGRLSYLFTELLVDVHTRRDYAALHIPGAINIQRELNEFAIWRQLGFFAATDYYIEAYL